MKRARKNPQSDNENVLLEEAERLLLRLHEPGSRLQELEEFDAWQRRSPKHREVAMELQQMWADIGRIQNLPWPSDQELAEDREQETEEPLRFYSTGPWRSRFAVIGGAMAAAVSAIVFIALTSIPQVTETRFETGFGEHQLIQLEDGSSIMLGAKSRVQVFYSDERRLVELEAGEGLFTVAKDAQRPFFVDTANVSVRAIGTAFNVRNGLEHVVVSVVEGSVRVSSFNTPPNNLISSAADDGGGVSALVDRDLAAGEEIFIGRDDSAVDVRTTDVTNAIAWRNGRFVFSGESLASVVAELNRYSESRIEIADGELGELTFSGTVLSGQMNDWLEGLERVYPMRVDRGQARIVIRAKPYEEN